MFVEIVKVDVCSLEIGSCQEPGIRFDRPSDLGMLAVVTLGGATGGSPISSPLSTSIYSSIMVDCTVGESGTSIVLLHTYMHRR